MSNQIIHKFEVENGKIVHSNSGSIQDLKGVCEMLEHYFLLIDTAREQTKRIAELEECVKDIKSRPVFEELHQAREACNRANGQVGGLHNSLRRLGSICEQKNKRIDELEKEVKALNKGNRSLRKIYDYALSGASIQSEKNAELEIKVEDTDRKNAAQARIIKSYQNSLLGIKQLETKLQKAVEYLEEIKEESEWAKMTISEKLTFGFDEKDAVYRRETRAKGVFLTTIGRCRRALKELKQ